MRRPSASKLSALTAENVPTPPAAAQWPAEMPLEMDTPLPPSISGKISIPPMRMALIARIGLQGLRHVADLNVQERKLLARPLRSNDCSQKGIDRCRSP